MRATYLTLPAMLAHLLELRQRLLHLVFFYMAGFLVCFYFADTLLLILFTPLQKALAPGDALIATRITAPVFTPLQVAAQAALIVTTPMGLVSLWRFISPGLYQGERQTLLKTLLASVMLFISGALFCFWVVLPFFFQLAARSLPGGIHLMPDMADSLAFVTRMLILFGLCFQVPLVCLALVHLKLVTVEQLRAFRPYAIVGAFTLGMLLTPPDVLSQVLLAIPLWLLFELGVCLAGRAS